MTFQDAYDLGLDALDLQLCLDMEANRPFYPVPLEQRPFADIQAGFALGQGTISLDQDAAES
jgi:hypothetical protein